MLVLKNVHILDTVSPSTSRFQRKLHMSLKKVALAMHAFGVTHN